MPVEPASAATVAVDVPDGPGTETDEATAEPLNAGPLLELPVVQEKEVAWPRGAMSRMLTVVPAAWPLQLQLVLGLKVTEVAD